MDKITYDKVEHFDGSFNLYTKLDWARSGPAYQVRRKDANSKWEFVKWLEKPTGRIIFGW